jgi:ABC-type nickel/cobalt efflux system permease component RcnA
LPPLADLRRLLRDRHQWASPAARQHGDHSAHHHQHPPRIRIGYPPLLHVFVGIIAFCLYLHQQTNKTHGRSFSQNPSWSKMKFLSWSKLFNCFGGCIPCSKCSTNVSYCGTSTITNNYRGQELESQASASKQAALPDLISM